MSLPGETVTILSPGSSTDPYSGDPVDDWSAPSEVSVPGVLCEPRPSGEPVQDARNAVTSGWTLYMPPGAPVTARQRVRVRGTVYEVLGEPADWQMGSWHPGLVVQCERTAG